MPGRPLTILNVGYPLAPVGPDAVGGAEQILTRIDEALVSAGHRSLVVAPYGSRVRGELIPVPTFRGRLDAAAQEAADLATREAIRVALERYPVDVVHFHEIRFDQHLPPPGVPVLAITRDRARAFDFLRGAESYKYLWGAVDQPLYRRVLRLRDAA